MPRIFSGTVFSSTEGVSLPENGCGITVGNFDGVHLGHQEIVRCLIESVSPLGLPSIAVTFDPHPAALLCPNQPKLSLTTIERRVSLLLALGLDAVCVVKTTPELLNLSAEQFYQEALRECFHPAAIVEGEDFHFGHNRQGTLAHLRRWSERDSIALREVSAVQVDGVAVSSSRIRALLEDGDVARAAELLLFPYALEGRVVRGQRRGAQLGFPTVNLHDVHTLVPLEGVYAGVATTACGDRYGAAIHVGKNLTFGAVEQTVEAHLIGFSGDLYGQVVEVNFSQRLRGTEKFKGPQALVEQLRNDVLQVESLSRLNLKAPRHERVSLTSADFSR